MQCRCLWPEEVCWLYFWEKSDENPGLFALTSLKNKPDRSDQAGCEIRTGWRPWLKVKITRLTLLNGGEWKSRSESYIKSMHFTTVVSRKSRSGSYSK